MKSLDEGFYRQLGERIRTARRAANLTQTALANAIGLSRTSLTNIEKGRQPVYAHTLARIGLALGIGADSFLASWSAPMAGTSGLSPKTLKGLDAKHRGWVERVISSSPTTTEGNKQ